MCPSSPGGRGKQEKSFNGKFIISLQVRSTSLHPRYRRVLGYAEFDVALLTLTQRVEFSDFIQPICLPAVETKVFY